MSFTKNDWFGKDLKKIIGGKPVGYLFSLYGINNLPVCYGGIGDREHVTEPMTAGDSAGGVSESELDPARFSYKGPKNENDHHILSAHYEPHNGASGPMERHKTGSDDLEYDINVNPLPAPKTAPSSGSRKLHVAAIGQYTHNSRALNSALHKRYQDYADDGYHDKTVENLKHGDDPHTHQFFHVINALDDLTRDHTVSGTPKDLTLYHGVHHSTISALHNSDHDMVHMPAYTSTSLNPQTAKTFAYNHSKTVRDFSTGKAKSVGHILRIKYPQGSHGAYIAHHSDQPNEREFIIPRGVTMKINKDPALSFHDQETNTTFHVHDAEPIAGHK